MKQFSSLGLSEQVIKALPKLGITVPTEIQEKAIPLLLGKPTDFIGLAQTGTGKTAAFGLPLLEGIDPKKRHTQALVLAPTRELCQQIAQHLVAFSEYIPGLKTVAVFGGAPIYSQILALKKPTHVVIATPGRLLDLIRRKVVKLDRLTNLVLDEADEMLNMGFKEELDEILTHVRSEKNTWLFSATMAPDIKRIIRKYMDPDAPEITVNAGQLINENIEHRYVRLRSSEKTEVLRKFLDAEPELRGIIFCRTRLGAQELAEDLIKLNYQADALHGDLSQGQRDRVMRRFKAHNLRLIVATDVAARGIDVDDLTHIIHHTLPDELGYYTHRSGRTARAGKKGISLVLAAGRDIRRMQVLDRNLKLRLKEVQAPSEAAIQAERVAKWTRSIAGVELIDKPDRELLAGVFKEFEAFSREELVLRFLQHGLGPDALRKAPAPAKKKGREARQKHVKREKQGKPEPRRSSSTPNMDRFFINVGRMDQVQKRELIEFLAEQMKLGEEEFGSIDIHERHSIFEMNKASSNRLASSFAGWEVNGRKLRISRDGEEPKKSAAKNKRKTRSVRRGKQRGTAPRGNGTTR